jgi:uncharacterized protein (DUF362 family)/NAD-dependent dihydropyrimidine dehydrogenase PreA subunit
MGSSRPEVSLVKCTGYELSESCVKKAIDLIGGMKSIVKPGDKVLLKVNLLLPANPSAAITTHPKIVEAMIKLVKSAGGEPWVGDSSGGRGKTAESIEVSGIKAICEKHDVRVVNFDMEGVHKIEIPKGKILKELYVAKALFEADKVVCMPKLKTHALTLYTGAIKNMFGCVPGGKKSLIHAITDSDAERFSESLVDIYSKVPIHLTVMDGIVGMEGLGPNHGKPKKSNVIMASKHALELDAISSTIMGFEPTNIPTLRIAQERGLGTIEPEKISVLGDDLKSNITNYKKPTRVYRSLNILPNFIKNLFLETPRLPFPNKAGCNQCGECQENCPVDAIKVTDAPAFDHHKCIRCYCCHELCPKDGIKLKKALLPRS